MWRSEKNSSAKQWPEHPGSGSRVYLPSSCCCDGISQAWSRSTLHGRSVRVTAPLPCVSRPQSAEGPKTRSEEEGTLRLDCGGDSHPSPARPRHRDLKTV